MQQDYVNARFLEWWSYHPRILKDDIFSGWMKYECEIEDPMEKTKQMIYDGYLCEGTIKEQLQLLTVSELKDIAAAHELKGKKKQELVELISEKCSPEQLNLNALIKITGKGKQFLRSHGIYDENDPACMEPYILYNEGNEIVGFNFTEYSKKHNVNAGMFSLVNSAAVDCIASLGFCTSDFSAYNAPNAPEFKRYLKIVFLWSVCKGLSEDKIIKAIKEKYPLDTKDAQMLVRTEHTYFANQAELNKLADAGFDEYEFMSAGEGNGSCDICSNLNGKRFKIVDAVVGANLPPMHIGCRCTIGAVIETDEDVQTEIDKLLDGRSTEDIERELDRQIAEEAASENIITRI